ncbi:MAG: carboxypeptidase regulatory-like domain-containing protein [Planctomycetes bacterium]|nr:carboxypeptidase regulatory-like domain-containing protein [Planctomycetota bacterium]
MKGRNGALVSILGALILLGMVGGYLLLASDDSSEPIVKPGVARDADGNPLDPWGDEARGGGRTNKSAGTDADAAMAAGGDNGGSTRAGTGAAGENPEDQPGNEAPSDVPVSFDPEEINEPVPGHLLIRVTDKEDERALPGTAVYFPIRGSSLRTEGGDVKLVGPVAGLAKRTNKHGVVIWSDKELARLIEDQKDAEDQTTSVLVSAIGYADLFEPLAIPDLKTGAEVTFKVYPSVRVTGKVREKRGGAVAYANVDILQTTRQGDAATPANRFSIQADALGEFTLKLADSYLYTFEVKQPGYASYTSRVFNFRQDQREVTILLEFARGISGIVVDPAGKPIEGANVLARDDGTASVTGADGKFTFDMVKDRIFRNDVNLRITAKGFAPRNEKVLANDHEVRIELEQEGALHGLVINEKNEPIAGALVECTYLEDRARYPYDAVVTDAEGKFKFGEFANGRVLLTATYQGLYSEEATTDVKPRTNVGPIKLKLTTGSAITGIVSCEGVGIAKVTLALNGKATGATADDGSYTLGGIKPGKHKVKILNEYPIADDQIRQLPVFTTDGLSFYYLPTEKELEVKLAESKTLNIEVKSFEAAVDRKITVKVITQPNTPETGVQVTIKPVFGSPPAGVEAPKTQVLAIDLPEGRADLPLSLLNGVSYEATFSHNRFFEAKLSAQALAGVQDGGEIELVLERAFIIKGYVKDSEGAGIESVGLSKDKNNPWNMQATTDIYGYFEFGQMKAGEYTITAFKTSYYQEASVVTIESEDPEPLQLVMVGANEIRIIVANNGTPQPGAHVHIYRNDAEGDDPNDFKRHFDIGTTDAKGEKYINFHWVRNYQIVAYHGSEVAFVNFNNLKEEPEREFTIELEPAYDLKGRVVDKDTMQPLPQVIVRAHIASTGVDGRDGNFFQLETDNAGNFAFRVPAGDYYFYVPQTSSHESFTTEGSNVAAGSLNLQLEVPLRDDIQGNYAQVLSISAPTSMTAGQQYTVEVTVKNMGSTTWTSAGNKPWRLGSQAPQDNNTWGMNRVPIPQGTEVRPKETYIFSFTVTAPSTVGAVAMQWRMVQDGKEWFGQLSEKLIVTVETASGE